MDPDSCHCVFHTRGHHIDPNPRPHPLLSVPSETQSWSSDCPGALVASLHICTIPVGACAAPPHHADVLDIQRLL